MNPYAIAVRTRRIVASAEYGPQPMGFAGKQTSNYPRSSWLDMPAAGESFTYINQAYPAAPAAVFLPAIGSEVTVVSFTVPQGKNVTLQELANQVVTGGWVDGSGSVLWRLEINGAAVQGYSAIPASLGTAARPGDISKRPVRGKENQLVALICRNISIVTAPNVNPLVGVLSGYFDSLSQGEQSTWI